MADETERWLGVVGSVVSRCRFAKHAVHFDAVAERPVELAFDEVAVRQRQHSLRRHTTASHMQEQLCSRRQHTGATATPTKNGTFVKRNCNTSKVYKTGKRTQ